MISVSILTAMIAIGIGVAQAAVGDLARVDCITGSLALTACSPTDLASADGADSGFDTLDRVEVSPDGTSVYATSSADDSILHFQRGGGGALTYGGCITGETESGGACTQIPDATSMGAGSGLNGPDDLAVSPDGRSVYVVTGIDDSIVRFNRNLDTGDLAYRDCFSAATDATPPCAQVPGASANGTNTGLNGLSSVAISPDGRSVFAGSQTDGAISHFSRDPAGALGFVGCLSANSNTPCAKIPGHAPNASDTGFDSLTQIAVSPDGSSLYTSSDSDEAVGEFSLDGDTGAPSFVRCVTGATTITNCTPIPGATANGNTTGLRSIVHISVSPDSKSVYTSADSDEAVAHFERAPSGALTFAGCFSGATATTGCTAIPGASGGAVNSGMNATAWAEPAPDGHSVYVLGYSDDAIVSFARDPVTGALTYRSCRTAETESAPPCTSISGATSLGAATGLDQPRGLAASPDGRSMYAAAATDDALTRFDREPDLAAPVATITSGPADGALLNSPSATFEFSSADGDLAAFGCETGGAGVAEFEGCSSPFTISGLADGEHSFAVRGTDIQGNEGVAESRSFTVDTTAPALRIRGKKVPLDRKRRAKVKLQCPATEISGPCRGTLKLKTRKKVKLLLASITAKKGKKRKKVVLAKKRYTVAAGKTKKVKLRLSRRKANTVRKKRKARKIRVIAKVRDAAGNQRKVAKKAKLQPQKRKR